MTDAQTQAPAPVGATKEDEKVATKILADVVHTLATERQQTSGPAGYEASRKLVAEELHFALTNFVKAFVRRK